MKQDEKQWQDTALAEHAIITSTRRVMVNHHQKQPQRIDWIGMIVWAGVCIGACVMAAGIIGLILTW
jgi:hypothetical protein